LIERCRHRIIAILAALLLPALTAPRNGVSHQCNTTSQIGIYLTIMRRQQGLGADFAAAAAGRGT